ncbi:MAG: thiolase family protein [Ectothiorhodospiraceae bacterium]|nr:thiolase family protein [Ectothiorhodospiraceae bacterium]
MNRVVIVEALRTPFGKFGGGLAKYSAVDLGGIVAQAALQRATVPPEDVDETFFGSALLVAATSVAARQINFKAGIPASTPSLTIDRACCSSMTCIGLAALKIRAGEVGVALAGGIESASQTPFLMKGIRWGHRRGDFTVEDPMQIRNPINGAPVARVTGEAALKFGVTREEQDEWALRSHQAYFKAYDSGVYDEELVHLDGADQEALRLDEPPRRNVSIDKLNSLETVYGSPTVTPGNAPGLNDGAAVALLMADEEAKRRDKQPLGEIVSHAQVSGELDSSVYMPGLAILTALKKAGLSTDDLTCIEINEAFAAMPLVSTKYMADGDAQRLDRLRSITNVNGGAVAIGHPTGASGARVVMALVRELRRQGGGYGAAAICGGYGQADAVVVRV